MSGPVILLPRSFPLVLGLALLPLAPGLSAAPALERETPPGPPTALRVERILDREALERLGVARPSKVAYDPDGNLYVLDPARRRVVKLDRAGEPLFQVGGYGDDPSSFSLPSDLVLDRRQSVLVLDRGKNEVVALDASGRFLGARSVAPDVAPEAFDPSARLLVDPFGELWLLAPRERDLVALDDRLERARRTRFLEPEDSLGAPGAAAFLPKGGGWIHDATAGALRRFGPSGRLLGSVSLLQGESPIEPRALAVDGSGLLYVADAGGQRVLVYDERGALRLERPLGGPSVPWRPIAIAVGPHDRVAIADPDRGEIQILAIERGSAP